MFAIIANYLQKQHQRKQKSCCICFGVLPALIQLELTSLSSLFSSFHSIFPFTPSPNSVFPNYLNVFPPALVPPFLIGISDLLSFCSLSWPSPTPLLLFLSPHFIFLAELRTFLSAVTFLVLN